MKSSQYAEAAANQTYNAVDTETTQTGRVKFFVEFEQPIYVGKNSVGATIDEMINDFYTNNPEGNITRLELDLTSPLRT